MPAARPPWDLDAGLRHHGLGHHSDAASTYHQAIALFRELGDRYYEANTLTRLGDNHRTAGDLAAARVAWREALEILTELGHRDVDAVRARLARLD